MFIQLQNNILQFISQEGLQKDIHAVYIYIQIAQTLCTKKSSTSSGSFHILYSIVLDAGNWSAMTSASDGIKVHRAHNHYFFPLLWNFF